MQTVRITIFFLILTILSSPALSADRLVIISVNYPLAYFAERIGGDQVDVVFPAPADVDPAYWMPDKATIAAYQQADLILLNGANYAKWIGKVSLPRSKMVDTSRNFNDRYIYASEVTTHSHGAAGAHAHESLAFTTWLDLNLAKLQAETIYKTLSSKRPTAEMKFKSNFQVLADELEKLHMQIREIVSRDPNLPLLGSHPIYDYLSAGYKMNLKSVHWEPNEIPTVSQWNELNLLLEEHQAKSMLWEGTPLQETVVKLKNKGIVSIVFNPGGNSPVGRDFMSIMQQNITNLKQVFQ